MRRALRMWGDLKRAEQVKIVKELGDSYTGGQYVKLLGDMGIHTTRNAIIAWFHRHGKRYGVGLSRSGRKPRSLAKMPSSPAEARRITAMSERPFKGMEPAPLPESEPAPEGGVPFSQYRYRFQCCWPLWPHDSDLHPDDKMVCGAATRQGQTLCDKHRRKAFTQPHATVRIEGDMR